MAMDEAQEAQLQEDIGCAPEDESSCKRRKLVNQEKEIEEKGVFSHADSYTKWDAIAFAILAREQFAEEKRKKKGRVDQAEPEAPL